MKRVSCFAIHGISVDKRKVDAPRRSQEHQAAVHKLIGDKAMEPSAERAEERVRVRRVELEGRGASRGDFAHEVCVELRERDDARAVGMDQTNNT